MTTEIGTSSFQPVRYPPSTERGDTSDPTPNPIRRPFQDLYHPQNNDLARQPTLSHLTSNPGIPLQAQSCVSLALPFRGHDNEAGYLGGSAKSEGFMRSKPQGALGPIGKETSASETTTGTAQRRKTKGRLGIGLPLSRLFGSSVDLLGDLNGLSDRYDRESADDMDLHRSMETPEKGSKGKASWLPFKRQRPAVQFSNSTGPHTRAGSGGGSRIAETSQWTGGSGRPTGKRNMTTGNLPTLHTLHDAEQSAANVHEAEEPVIIIGSALRRKGSIKNMLDKFAGKPRPGGDARGGKGNDREADGDGVEWDMMSTKEIPVKKSLDTAHGSLSVAGSGSGSGSVRPSADSAKRSQEGYSAGEIVPRHQAPPGGLVHGLQAPSRTERQAGCLAVPGAENGKIKRRPSWRKAGRNDVKEDDEGIGAPMLVQHNLHVTASFKGLPPAWIEQLRQQGIGQREMEMIMSGRRQKESISSLENMEPEAAEMHTEPAPSPLRTVKLPEITPHGSPSANKKIRGLTLPGAYGSTPLHPAPRPVRPTVENAMNNKASLDTLPGAAIPTGTLIDRDLLRSPVQARPTKHFRTSSENLLGSVLNGIQQGHKKSVSYLHNLQPGSHRDDEPILENDTAGSKRPLRFRRRAGTEDSPLLLNLSKDTAVGPELYSAFTPIQSQARSRLSTEVKNFGTIKLSFETDRSEGRGGDDWAGEVLLSLDQGRSSADGQNVLPKPSMDSAVRVPRSVSVETGFSASYQNLCLLEIPDSRFRESTPRGYKASGTTDSEPSEMIQSPEEIASRHMISISPLRSLDDNFLMDRTALDIGMSVPRSPTPPGKEPRTKKMSVSPPRRKSSLNRSRLGEGIFGRDPSDELYIKGRPSEDGPAPLLYRTISLSPSPDLASLADDDTFLTPTASDEHGHPVDTARYSEAMSWDGPLSTTEDHSFSLGTVHTAWRAAPLNFNVFGQTDDANPRDVKRERS